MPTPTTYTLPGAVAASVCAVSAARCAERSNAALAGVWLSVTADGSKPVVCCATNGRVMAEHAIPTDNPPAGPDAEDWQGIIDWEYPATRKGWVDAAKACKPGKGKPHGALLAITPAPGGRRATLEAAGQTWTVRLIDGTFPEYAPVWAYGDGPGVVAHWQDAGRLAAIPGCVGLGGGQVMRCRTNTARLATVYEPAGPAADGIVRRALLMGIRPTNGHADADGHADAATMRRRILELECERDGMKRQLAAVAALAEDAAEYGGRNDGNLHVAVAQARRAAALARGPWAACN